MKNNRITRAYDSINPTASDKERMLDHILANARLEERSGTQNRRVRPETRHARKKQQFRSGWILPLTACLALLLLAGFLLSRRNIQPETPSLAKPMYEMTAMDHYAPVLDKYRRAMEEGWTQELCELEGISPNMQYVTQKTGYALLDLDSDGREELIIAQEASPDHDIVWDLYTTLEDGTPIQLLSDEGVWFNCGIFQNGVIGIDRSRKQPGEHEYYTIQSGQLVLLDSLFPEGDQMMRMDQDGNKVPVSDQEAMEIVYSYKFRKLDLIWLEELRDAAASDRYQEVLDIYRRAIAESWSRERCQTEGISPRMQSGADLTHAGYALLDLDNDGREELIIAEGSTHIANVWDLYTTQEDGTPVRLFMDACDGNQCNVYAGNYIRIDYSGKTAGETNFYTLENGQLVMRERVVYEGDDIRHTDVQGNTRAITNQEYMEISNSYQNLELELIWLADIPDYLQDTDTMERYTIVLEQYKTALTEKWDPGMCMDHDISMMVSRYAEMPDMLCAFYLDLDEDGIAELMITDGMLVFDLYTMRDGHPVHLLTGWERNSYRFCMDNVISNHASNSAYNTSYRYYRLENGELVLVDSVVFDASVDPDKPWFRSTDGETPVESISEQEADAMIASYVDMSILGTPILQLP